MLIRRLGTGRIKVWSCDIIVDWADPQVRLIQVLIIN